MRGHIQNKVGGPLVGANILIVETQKGASTDANGEYRISDISVGDYTLRISLVGYGTQEQRIAIIEEGETIANFQLEQSPVPMREVTIQAEREVSRIDEREPVRKEIIIAEDLRESTTDGGVLTALSDKTGLKVRPCSICGSCAIGMQGLDPSYTEVNMDGLPVFSGLGTLYGLYGLSATDVTEVEIVKGSGSNLFGSGAIAGGVNRISTKPSDSRSLEVNISGSDTRQHALAVSASEQLADTPFRLSGTYGAEPEKIDRNGDGVTDTPTYQRINFTTSLSRTMAWGDLRVGGRLYREHRFAGEPKWTEKDKGSPEVYGRDITTSRDEFSLVYANESSARWEWSFEGALVRHKQESWYGTTSFNALQQILLAKGSLERVWNGGHSALLQGIFRLEDYTDNLALSSPTDRLYRIPGLVAQYTWNINPGWTLQAGNRLEHINDFGWVSTPRGSLLWRPTDPWGIRLSGGGGFRPVTIFSLDEAVGAGFDHVLPSESLKPERSVSGSLAINRRWVEKTYSAMMDISAFYTDSSSMVVLAYGREVGAIVYSNARNAYSRGVELQFTVRNTSGWNLRLGGTRTNVQYEDQTGWHETNLQYRYAVNGALEKVWIAAGLSSELSAALYGPQKLPEGRERSVSPAYVLLDARISKSWGALTLAGTIKNLTNWTQPDSPFQYSPTTGQPLLDSALMYGPRLGRIFVASLTFSLGGKDAQRSP